DAGRGLARTPAVAVFQDAPEGSESVAPANLLTLGVAAAFVRDPDLVNPATPESCELRRHFGVEAETVLLQREVLYDLATKDFVASLDVGQIQVRKGVGEDSQNAVSERVPEGQDAVGVAPGKTRSVDDVRTTVENRPKQPGVFRRVVFQVG